MLEKLIDDDRFLSSHTDHGCKYIVQSSRLSLYKHAKFCVITHHLGRGHLKAHVKTVTRVEV